MGHSFKFGEFFLDLLDVGVELDEVSVSELYVFLVINLELS